MEYRQKSDWVSWCIPTGTISGVRIGIHWTFPLFILLETSRAFGSGGPQWGWAVLVTLVLLYLIVLAHEFGHILAARREGIPTDRVMLWPLGGLAYIGEERHGPPEVRIAAAGPAVNLAFALLWLPVLALLGFRIDFGLADPFDWTDALSGSLSAPPLVLMVAFALFKVNLICLLFNLIPAFPLDGGRILRGLLHPKHGLIKSTLAVTTVSLVITSLFVVWAVAKSDFLLLMIALFVGWGAYATRRQIQAVRAAHESERSLFGVDFSVGGGSTPELFPREVKAEDKAAARREEKERKRREREVAEEREIDAEVDSLLEKISREGIGSLTRKEKAFLNQASRRKREAR